MRFVPLSYRTYLFSVGASLLTLAAIGLMGSTFSVARGPQLTLSATFVALGGLMVSFHRPLEGLAGVFAVAMGIALAGLYPGGRLLIGTALVVGAVQTALPVALRSQYGLSLQSWRFWRVPLTGNAAVLGAFLLWRLVAKAQ